MRVTIRLFARLRDIVGRGELEREIDTGATAQTLWDGLAAEYPALAPYGRVISCAVNEDYAALSAPVADGDEVAFLPPVSGGTVEPCALSRDKGQGTRDKARAFVCWTN